MIRLALPILAFAAGGCATTLPVSPRQCDAAPAPKFVGRPFTDQVGDDARKATGSASVRVIRPNQAVTMDYRIDRLNIELDASDRIAALRCG